MKRFLFVFLLLALLALSACSVVTPTPNFIQHQIITLNQGNTLWSVAAGRPGIDSDAVCNPTNGQRFEVMDPPLPVGDSYWYRLSPMDNSSIDCLNGWIQQEAIPHQ